MSAARPAAAPHPSQLAGSLRVVPGAPLPLALQSSRQDWAPRLVRRQPASALPGLMASLFNLCSHAHRLCSQLAIEAAAPGLLPAPQNVSQRLRAETAQEHIRRIGLDWPRLLGAEQDATNGSVHAAHTALQRCPLLLPPATLAPNPWPALRGWLHGELLQMPPPTWLHAWNASGADWLSDWSHRQTGWLPELLRTARHADLPHTLARVDALYPHAHVSSQRTLASTLASQADFALYPQWNGTCAHTGNWARLNGKRDDLPLSPWALLGSRIAELIRLSQPNTPGQSGAAWLSHGSLNTGPRQGLAWVEMARGLLVHRVEIEEPAGDAPARVIACQVLAPTEWNCHPQGVVAQCISALDTDQSAQDTERRVRLLMAAFDPCVPFGLTHSQSTAREVLHA